MKNASLGDQKLEGTKLNMKRFNTKKGRRILKNICKIDVKLLPDIFEKNTKVSKIEFDINSLYCVSLPGCT